MSDHCVPRLVVGNRPINDSLRPGDNDDERGGKVRQWHQRICDREIMDNFV